MVDGRSRHRDCPGSMVAAGGEMSPTIPEQGIWSVLFALIVSRQSFAVWLNPPASASQLLQVEACSAMSSGTAIFLMASESPEVSMSC